MRKYFCLLILLVSLCSCASLFNGNTTKVKVYTPENTTIAYKNQITTIEDGETTLSPERSKDSLRFTLKNDSITEDFSFKRKISGSLYLNALVLPPYGLSGILVDLTNQRRFTYQRHLYFKIDSTSANFQLFKGKTEPFKQQTIFIYSSPLLALDISTQPMVSLGVEYFPLDNFSISAEYATVFTDRLRDNSNNIKLVENKGRAFRYELKYYNLLSISSNPRVNEYIGIEARFIRTQFNESISYSRANQDFNVFVQESIAVIKSVDIFNLKYGLNYPIGKRMYIDLYSGFGFRIKTFKNPNRQFNPETDRLLNDDDSWIFNFDSNYLEGTDDQKLFNFSFGFKFGIKF
jgi:hypothetical protein